MSEGAARKLFCSKLSSKSAHTGGRGPEFLEGLVLRYVWIEVLQVSQVLHPITQTSDLEILVGERCQVPNLLLSCNTAPMCRKVFGIYDSGGANDDE